MMVQTAAENEAHFVLTMRQHLDLCGQFARSFGNDRFQRLDPRDETLYAVDNHDRGWDSYDADPKLDPQTGLPYSLACTPAADTLKTITASPDFNERHHAYCGILVSMHTWGLYNGRYGFSQFVVRQRSSTSIAVAQAHKAEIESRLARELQRQERLKSMLAAKSETRRWVDDAHVFQNYKQLQFFDTLALYFHLRHDGERGREVYIHVPMSSDADATITVQPLGDGQYGLDPFPFADSLKAVCRGRYVTPFRRDQAPADLGAALRSVPVDSQSYTLLPG